MGLFGTILLIAAAFLPLLPRHVLAHENCVKPSPLLCSVLRNGQEPCKHFLDAADEEAWYSCQCEDGAAAIELSCNACEESLSSLEHWEARCADHGFSLKPTPAALALSMGLGDMPARWFTTSSAPQPAITLGPAPSQSPLHIELLKRQDENEKSVLLTDRTILSKPSFLSITSSLGGNASASASAVSTSGVDTGVIPSQDESSPTLTGALTISLETPDTTASSPTASGTGAGSAANVQFVQETGLFAIVAGSMSFGLMLLL